MKKSEGFVKVGGGSTTGKLGVTWCENKPLCRGSEGSRGELRKSQAESRGNVTFCIPRSGFFLSVWKQESVCVYAVPSTALNGKS